MKKTQATVFVAETDEGGHISWVWRLGPNDRAARPVRNASNWLSELNGAEFHGASAGAISEWIRAQSSSC